MPPASTRHTPAPALAAPWQLTWADGSGNRTRLWQDSPGAPVRWTYIPITPAESSSGLYSGGEPAEGVVDAEPLAALLAELLRLEADPDGRAPSRMKGTGLFVLEENGAERAFIVRGDSLGPWRATLERATPRQE